jgi:predicted aldo/keto reductase-like oxidoreductase
MADLYMSKGFRYFDTAFTYNDGKSESAFRECVAKRYPRESYFFTTKLPTFEALTPQSMREITDIQFERTGLDFFDLYLIHAIDEKKISNLDEINVWEYMTELKSTGKVGNIGFSFHGKPELLESILSSHPEVDVVLLQINYLDQNNPKVASKACYEIARNHEKPIIVMEPLKGGSLVTVAPSVLEKYKASKITTTLPELAFKFIANLEGVEMILSGMSSLEQLDENTDIFLNDFKSLSKDEISAIDEITKAYNAIELVPCTHCRYCINECPKHIPINRYFGIYNSYKKTPFIDKFKKNYLDIANSIPDIYAGAEKCINCGKCEERCPQHIEIRKNLKSAYNIYKS